MPDTYQKHWTEMVRSKLLTAIMRDFLDRRGFRQAWDIVDPETQQECIDAWEKIISENKE